MNSVLQFTTLHLQFQTAKLNLQDHDKLKLSPSVQQITKITIDKNRPKATAIIQRNHKTEESFNNLIFTLYKTGISLSK